MIYFDSSATNPLLPVASSAMINAMNLSIKKSLGNPSSLHTPGSLGRDLLDSARSSIAQLLDCRKNELIFTSGGSESNNTVIHTFEHCPIFVSAIEHPSVIKPAEEYGSPCVKIPVNEQGTIDIVFLKTNLLKVLEKDPRQKILISVMFANNETGVIEPIAKIIELIQLLKKEGHRNIFLHTDATQAIGKIPISTKNLCVDYLTCSSHKIGGPVGIGGLFVRSGTPFRPLIFGGAQENKRRAGTSNVVLASGFAAAANYALSHKTWELYAQKIAPLRDYLAAKLSSRIPSTKIISPLKSSTEKDCCLPNILSVSFPAAEGESTQLYLDLAGFAISTGSACASGDLEPSHVLMAMFHDAEIAHGSIRFSFNLSTKKKDVDTLLTALPAIVEKIQSISTLTVTKEPINE